jgi:hypothetical protein
VFQSCQDREIPGGEGMTNKDLKPCPFCGSKAEFVNIGEHFYVSCTKNSCAAYTDGGMRMPERAAKRWNRRVPSVPTIQKWESGSEPPNGWYFFVNIHGTGVYYIEGGKVIRNTLNNAEFWES